MPVITVAPNNDLLEKLKSNLMEVRARGGELIVFADPESGITPSRRRDRHPDAEARELLPGAGRLHRAAAAAGVSRRHPQGHRRRSAAQSREVASPSSNGAESPAGRLGSDFRFEIVIAGAGDLDVGEFADLELPAALSGRCARCRRSRAHRLRCARWRCCRRSHRPARACCLPTFAASLAAEISRGLLHEPREAFFLDVRRHMRRDVIRRGAFDRRILERADAIELRLVEPG